MSPSAPPALSMPDTGQGSVCTSSQSQPLDRTSSTHSPLDLHHTSLPQESHTNDIMPSTETTKSTQTGFPFLSLPPEIRNMIYHYIFTPVRDGTCLAVCADWGVTRLQAIRHDCSLCRSTLEHTTCQSKQVLTKDTYFAFDLSSNYTRSGILQTCSTVLKEASTISLACMHIRFDYSCRPDRRLSKALQLLLAYMHQPKGAYLSVLTCTYYTTHSEYGHGMSELSQLVNGPGIRIGHLILCEPRSSVVPGTSQNFVLALDSLHHKPTKVEWTIFCGTGASSEEGYESQRIEFNEAAEEWLAKLAGIEASDPTARLPLLRDSLPQFFEESAG
jgi:hypothetical protein